MTVDASTLELTGIHHLTAVTADAGRNHRFYTQTLGMRLVKKTVNQDDTSAYHLFYADAQATPGTDLTFFDWPVPPERRGTNAIVRTFLRVGTPESLEWWAARLADAGVAHAEIDQRYGRAGILFDDPEGQRLGLVVDPSGEAHPWPRSPVPAHHQIRGLGPIVLSVADLARTQAVLLTVLNMRAARRYAAAGSEFQVFEMGLGGAQGELHLVQEEHAPPASQGAGCVHHVAFRTPDAAQYARWAQRLSALRVANSGPIDRFYFKSLYFREPNGILFEIATDGPGFATDEPLGELGERLALPPFLEPRRKTIEARLKPLV